MNVKECSLLNSRNYLRFLEKFTLILALISAASLSLAQQDPGSTEQIRLNDIFDLRPGDSPYAPRPAHYDPNGTLLLIPDTSLWKAPPPTPEPAPAPPPELAPGMKIQDIPHILETYSRGREIPRNPFRPQNASGSETPPAGSARLTIRTGYQNLRVEYRLLLAEGESGEPMVFFHAGPMEETITVTGGPYQLERRIWLPDQPEAVYTERYQLQELLAGRSYRFIPDEPEESRIVKERLR